MLMPTCTRMCVQSFPYYFVNVCVITNITPPLIYTIGSHSAVNYLQRPGVHSLPFCASQIYYIIKWQDKVSKFILLSEKTLQHFHLTCFVEACISLLNDECSLFTAWTQIQTCALYRKKTNKPCKGRKKVVRKWGKSKPTNGFLSVFMASVLRDRSEEKVKKQKWKIISSRSFCHRSSCFFGKPSTA